LNYFNKFVNVVEDILHKELHQSLVKLKEIAPKSLFTFRNPMPFGIKKSSGFN